MFFDEIIYLKELITHPLSRYLFSIRDKGLDSGKGLETFETLQRVL